MFIAGFAAGAVVLAIGFWLGYRVKFDNGEVTLPEVPFKGKTKVLDHAVYPDE